MEVISDARLARLHPTGDHPERPERVGVLLEELAGYGEGRAATAAELERCHTAEHVELVRSTRTPSWLDPDTICTETSWEAALLAAGLAITAADRGAFALARPPGHHALPGRAMGFCLFNNVAVAACHAQAELGLERIAILDWDVHHGNGTQAIFWDDPSVLYVSLHQWPFYPGTGGPEEQSETVLNIPFPGGAGDLQYLEAFHVAVEPKLRRFDPDLLLVSAGFDAHVEDPLADIAVTEEGFRELARRAAALAPRIAAVLEGGYNLRTLPRLVEAALEGFAAET
ncbi:MAG: histone deacetylase family protein [Gaiellaceae bacterium]